MQVGRDKPKITHYSDHLVAIGNLAFHGVTGRVTGILGLVVTGDKICKKRNQ
jgi:hypothetical protein